ncbi:hypothetical protein KC333_g2494 [Hortaea werneckii]|nr:hypothetical protein KC333_g2494 [Hortaea werneckii]KAI7319931.1 hypothetical protein KC326_g2899 [Hortaea werneckii]
MEEDQLNNSIIRTSEPAELAEYLLSAARRYGSQAVSSHLLQAATTESIPAKAVFSVWLPACQDPACVVTAMTFEHSHAVREMATKRFGKLLRSARFGEAWIALGGVEGALEYLAGASVRDVAFFCRTIARTGTSTKALVERQEAIAELLQALLPQYFPNTMHRTSDKRPLERCYALMIAAGTPEIADTCSSLDIWPQQRNTRYLSAHPYVARRQCLEAMTAKDRFAHFFKTYGPLTRSIPREPVQGSLLSASMSFSITILEELTAGRITIENDFLFWNDFCIPLLRRLYRRRCSAETCTKVVKLLHQNFSFSGKELLYPGLNRGAMLATVSHVVKIWSRYPQGLEPVLKDFFNTFDSRDDKILHSVVDWISAIRPQLRYDLVKLFLASAPCFNIDIEDDDQLKASDFRWPYKLFFTLPKASARSLMERLTRLRLKGDFIDPRHIEGYTISTKCEESYGRVQILLYLSQGDSDHVQHARDAVRDSQAKSERSADKYERARWANRSFLRAFASGDLTLVADVVIWIRRYNRDPLTVPCLYRFEVLEEGIGLLSGMLLPSTPGFEAFETVQSHVKEGNKILLMLFETACMCAREPSFNPKDWDSLPTLAMRVVQMRLDRVDALQRRSQVSDTVVYDSVWADTIQTVLAIERMCHQQPGTKLGWNCVGGQLQDHNSSLQLTSESQSSHRFIDELARQRDELWQSFRKGSSPTVVTLPHPWPRGLPLQWLAPGNMLRLRTGCNLPYLETRAESIVFIPSDAAQKSVEGMEDTVGIFVEDWKAALQIFVVTAARGQREARIRGAWEHALHHLTPASFSATQAILFWKEIFSQAGLETRFVTRPLPKLPASYDALRPQEWDPASTIGLDSTRKRGVESTILTFMLSMDCIPPTTKLNEDDELTNSVEVPRPSFWQYVQPIGRPHPSGRESIVAAALLLTGNSSGASSHLTTAPFPSARDVRFPAAYLDETFLEASNDITAAIDCLKKNSGNVPLKPVEDVSHNTFSTARERTEEDDISKQLRLLKLLARGDRPASAIKFVMTVVLEHPDDSSWHWQLLTNSLLNGLGSREATDLVKTLAESMRQRMIAQKDNRETVPSRPSGYSGFSAIKVTTIKLFALLLAGRSFVDDTIAAQSLISLLSCAQHIDVRAALVRSLLEILARSQDTSAKEEIVSALESYAIPIIAAFDERFPSASNERLVSSDSLPEINNPSDTDRLGPSTEAIMNFCTGDSLSYKASEADRQRLLERVLLPGMQLSVVRHREWSLAFAQQRGCDLMSDEIPSVPVKPEILVIPLFRCGKWMPAAALDAYADLMATRLAPSSHLDAVTQKVLNDSELRQSNAGEHWLSIWDGNGGVPHRGRYLEALLKHDLEPASSQFVSHHQVQRQVLRIFDLALRQGDQSFPGWGRGQLGIRKGMEPEDKREWDSKLRPVVEEMINRVESLRTEEWQRDPNRTPKVLPRTFPLRLWLLDYPVTSSEQETQVFAGEIIDLLRMIANDHRPYNQAFEDIKDAILNLNENEMAYVTVALGSLPDLSSINHPLADHLRIALAADLLRHSSTVNLRDVNLIKEIRQMVQAWLCSCDEDIRMCAFSLIKEMKGRQSRHRGGWVQDFV